jgi:hypothetical protein
MKKLMTFALAAAMTMASSIIAFADDPIAVIPNTYTFENAEQSDAVVDKWENPFHNGGYDTVTVQYTATISSSPKYLTGYDTVMTFGSQGSFVYVCNELVGMNNGQFVDYWPSGTPGTLVYPGRGETYTVNLVFSADGVAFYLNGELQAGSNVAAVDADGNAGTATAQDILDILNTQDTLYIGDNGSISYWAEQDMVLSNIAFFNGAVTTPYAFTGSETKANHISSSGEVETQATTQAKEESTGIDTSKDQVEISEAPQTNTTMIIVIVVVVIVIVLGVAAFVILSQRRR